MTLAKPSVKIAKALIKYTAFHRSRALGEIDIELIKLGMIENDRRFGRPDDVAGMVLQRLVLTGGRVGLDDRVLYGVFYAGWHIRCTKRPTRHSSARAFSPRYSGTD